MAGFPNRISRATFGPTLVDTHPVVDPRKAIPAKAFNLNFWQTAGMNLTAARGLLIVRMNGTTPETEYQGLAFDPAQALPKVVWSRVGAGQYAYTFPEVTYPDMDGNAVTLQFVAGLAAPQTLIGGDVTTSATHELTGPRAGTVHTHASGSAGDIPDGGAFLLALY